MDGVDPGEVASRATQEREEQRSHAKVVLEWLLADERLGEMYPREDLITELSAQTDLEREQAASGVRGTVGDVVDPVQQVTAGNDKYVGVIEYRTYPDAGAYGYVQYHDRLGGRKRVVCAKCVEEADLEENVSHATEGEGTAPPDCGWDALLERIESHYDDAHNGVPGTIEPGASLLSNTTIGGNTAFHAGNDGPGSGLDADTLDGSGPSNIGSLLQRDKDGQVKIDNSTTAPASIPVTPTFLTQTDYSTTTSTTYFRTTVFGTTLARASLSGKWQPYTDNRTTVTIFASTGSNRRASTAVNYVGTGTYTLNTTFTETGGTVTDVNVTFAASIPTSGKLSLYGYLQTRKSGTKTTTITIGSTYNAAFVSPVDDTPAYGSFSPSVQQGTSQLRTPTLFKTLTPSPDLILDLNYNEILKGKTTFKGGVKISEAEYART